MNQADTNPAPPRCISPDLCSNEGKKVSGGGGTLMNWKRREEAKLTECVKYGYGCSNINPDHAPEHWYISELCAQERKGKRGE